MGSFQNDPSISKSWADMLYGAVGLAKQFVTNSVLLFHLIFGILPG